MRFILLKPIFFASDSDNKVKSHLLKTPLTVRHLKID